MKLLKHTILLLFWANISMAQSNYHKIFIIQNNDEKIIGQTYQNDKVDNCYQLTYLKSLEEEVKYSPGEIKSYVIKNNLSNKEETYKSLKYLDKENKEIQVFGKVLYEGAVNLYKVYFSKEDLKDKTGQGKYYYLAEKGDVIEKLIYFKESFPVSNQRQPYFTVLNTLFNTTDLDKQIKQTAFKDKPLIQLLNEYDRYLYKKDNLENNGIDYVPNFYKPIANSPVKFVLSAGATIFLNDGNNQTGFNTGMMVDFVNPAFSNTISFNIGFDYNVTKKEDTFTSKWLEVPLFANLTTDLSADNYLFFGSGVVFNSLSTKRLEYPSPTSTSATEVFVSRSFVSPAISIGGVIGKIKIFTVFNFIGASMEETLGLVDLNIGFVF